VSSPESEATAPGAMNAIGQAALGTWLQMLAWFLHRWLLRAPENSLFDPRCMNDTSVAVHRGRLFCEQYRRP
jgi:hypothetical protein